MPTTRLLFLLGMGCLSAPCLSSPVGAQSLEPVGAISGGNQVALERATTKREKGEITATFRTTFTKPAKVPGGEWFGSRTVVSVRCADGTAAVKANRYYSDKAFKTVASEKVVKIPGYAAPVPGSVPMLALRHFCPGK